MLAHSYGAGYSISQIIVFVKIVAMLKRKLHKIERRESSCKSIHVEMHEKRHTDSAYLAISYASGQALVRRT